MGVAKNKGRVIGSFCLRGSQKLWLGLLLKVFPCEIQFIILGREVAVSLHSYINRLQCCRLYVSFQFLPH